MNGIMTSLALASCSSTLPRPVHLYPLRGCNADVGAAPGYRLVSLKHLGWSCLCVTTVNGMTSTVKNLTEEIQGAKGDHRTA
jgi:hypothetical protein